MLCKDPILIRNKYTKKWMYIPCGKCECCMIQKSIDKTQRLNEELSNYGVYTFITLTYRNDCIPFAVNGSKFLCRGCIDTPYLSVELLEKFDSPFKIDRSYPVAGEFPFVVAGFDYMTVLYKRDYQLLFKKIRRYGKIKFRYFIAGEYGTFSKRAHFHVIFRTNKEQECALIERLVSKHWSLCDWSRLGESAIQRCGKGVGSYLSSYVNCYSDRFSVLLPRRFKAFTRRSSKFDYGFNAKESKVFETLIKREYGKSIFDFNQQDFEVRRGSTPNLFSPRIISANIFNSYFPKPKGFCDLSYVGFCLCCYRIFRALRYKSRNNRYPRFEEELSSLDLTFFRGYRRVCFILDIEVYDFENFVEYVHLHYKITNFYLSLQLKVQMLEYEKLSPFDYVLTQYNTFSSNPSYNYVKSIYRQFGIRKIPESTKFHTSKKLSAINEIVRTNHYKTLPKHLNNLLNKQDNL